METFIASPERRCSHCGTGFIYQATHLEVFCLTCGNQLSSDPDLVGTYQGQGWDGWIVKEFIYQTPKKKHPGKTHTTWTPEFTFPNPDSKEKGMGQKKLREYRAQKLKLLVATYPRITQAEAMRVTGWIRGSLMLHANLIGHTFQFKQGGKITLEEKQRRNRVVSQALFRHPEITSKDLASLTGLTRTVVQNIAKTHGHRFPHWKYQARWVMAEEDSDQQENKGEF